MINLKTSIKEKIIEEELWKLIDEELINVYIMYNGRLTYVSPQFANIFGYSTDELVNKHYLELFHVDDHLIIQENVNKRLNKVIDKSRYKVRGVKKNGAIIYLEINGHLSVAEDGNSYIVGTILDITSKFQNERRLSEAYNDLSLVMDHSPDAIVLLDLEKKVKLWNRAAEQIFGWEASEVLGQLFPIIQADKKEEFDAFFNKVMRGEKIPSTEVVRKRKDGSLIDVSISVAPYYNVEKKIEGYLGIFKDLTDKKSLEEALSRNQYELRKSEEKFRCLVQNMADVIIITDIAGDIQYHTPSLLEVLGYEHSEVINTSVFAYVFPDDIPIAEAKYYQSLNSPRQHIKFEFRVKHADESWKYISGGVTNLLDEPSVSGLVINYKDVTFEKEAREKIDHITYNDELTGLPNRSLFESELENHFVEAKKTQSLLAVLYIDLDRFKYVNDTLGYEFGDRLLIDVSKRLRNFLPYNTYLSRISGDEFVVLFSEIIDFEEIKNLANELILLFDKPYLVESYEFFLTCSIGISIYPFGSDSTNTLMKNATAAVSHAKSDGKNQYQIYSPTMNVGNYKAFTLKNDLRKAFQQEELYIHYQPQVNVKTNKIVGVEALIRWEHPNWGAVSPNEFIHLIEEAGLTVFVGDWVLEEACKQNKKWQEAGLPFVKMSVNFSPIQLLQSDCVDKVFNVLEKYQLEAECLEIEITENTFIKNEEKALETVQRLRQFGVGVAIDDFGTGFSSLKYLQNYKVSKIKIDKSFVNEVTTNRGSENIVKSIIDLAGNLQLQVVAEGVESGAQLQLLKKMNCQIIQGFLFSKAVCRDTITEYLQNGAILTYEVNNKESASYENRREFFRIELEHPLSADMTILKIGEKQVQLGSTEVLIEDIGPGGIGFLTNIQLPKRVDIILGFDTEILNQNMKLTGYIVWNREVEDGIYQYGLKFNFDKVTQEKMIKIFNQFQVSLKNKQYKNNSRFILKNRHMYLKSKD